MVDRSVLIVDDDPSIRLAVSDALELEGYVTRTASNGAEALAEVERQSPCLVLLDMRMPIMDGWAFAEEVRRRAIALKILVMTASGDARVTANEVHADSFLGKPFELDTLLAEVARLCRA